MAKKLKYESIKRAWPRAETEILKRKWNILKSEILKSDHFKLDDGTEFYAFSGWGNLLFTPDEVEKARLRFQNYPKEMP